MTPTLPGRDGPRIPLSPIALGLQERPARSGFDAARLLRQAPVQEAPEPARDTRARLDSALGASEGPDRNLNTMTLNTQAGRSASAAPPAPASAATEPGNANGSVSNAAGVKPPASRQKPIPAPAEGLDLVTRVRVAAHARGIDLSGELNSQVAGRLAKLCRCSSPEVRLAVDKIRESGLPLDVDPIEQLRQLARSRRINLAVPLRRTTLENLAAAVGQDPETLRGTLAELRRQEGINVLLPGARSADPEPAGAEELRAEFGDEPGEPYAGGIPEPAPAAMSAIPDTASSGKPENLTVGMSAMAEVLPAAAAALAVAVAAELFAVAQARREPCPALVEASRLLRRVLR